MDILFSQLLQDLLEAGWDAHFFETAKSITGIMAALGDVAVFGRRINIGVNGMALTRHLLIHI